MDFGSVFYGFCLLCAISWMMFKLFADLELYCHFGLLLVAGGGFKKFAVTVLRNIHYFGNDTMLDS